MKSLTISVALLMLSATPSIADSNATVEKTLPLREFSRIEIAGVFQLEVAVGEDYSIALSGPEKEMAMIDAGVIKDTLVLDMRDRRKGEKQDHNRQGVKAVIKMPALNAIDLSGVGEVRGEGINAETFTADMSGVGKIALAGGCRRLDARVSGVGEIDFKALKCRDVKIQVSGVGEASVFADNSVDAEVSGIGKIDVQGSPKAVAKKSGLFSEITIH